MLLIPYKSTLTCRFLNRLSYAFTIGHPFTSHIHVDWARMVDFHVEYLKVKTVDFGKMMLSSQSDSFLCLAFRFIVRVLFDSSWYPCSNWNHRFKVQGPRSAWCGTSAVRVRAQIARACLTSARGQCSRVREYCYVHSRGFCEHARVNVKLPVICTVHT